MSLPIVQGDKIGDYIGGLFTIEAEDCAVVAAAPLPEHVAAQAYMLKNCKVFAGESFDPQPSRLWRFERRR